MANRGKKVVNVRMNGGFVSSGAPVNTALHTNALLFLQMTPAPATLVALPPPPPQAPTPTITTTAAVMVVAAATAATETTAQTTATTKSAQ